MSVSDQLLALQVVAAQGIVTEPPTMLDGATLAALPLGEYTRVYRNLTGRLVSVTIEATFAGTGELVGVSQTDGTDGQVATLKANGIVITPALWVAPNESLFMANLSGIAPPTGASFAIYTFNPLSFAALIGVA